MAITIPITKRQRGLLPQLDLDLPALYLGTDGLIFRYCSIIVLYLNCMSCGFVDLGVRTVCVHTVPIHPNASRIQPARLWWSDSAVRGRQLIVHVFSQYIAAVVIWERSTLTSQATWSPTETRDNALDQDHTIRISFER